MVNNHGERSQKNKQRLLRQWKKGGRGGEGNMSFTKAWMPRKGTQSDGRKKEKKKHVAEMYYRDSKKSVTCAPQKNANGGENFFPYLPRNCPDRR